MCWAACDRLAKIATNLGLGDRAGYWRKAAERIRKAIEKKAWIAGEGRFSAIWGGSELDGCFKVAAVRANDVLPTPRSP